jgi:hypothetical protein
MALSFVALIACQETEQCKRRLREDCHVALRTHTYMVRRGNWQFESICRIDSLFRLP